MLGTGEKILNITLALLVLGAYGALALRFRHRLRELISRSEPAIFLDSARVIAYLVWLRFMPDAAAVARSLESTSALAIDKGLFNLIDIESIPPSSIAVAVAVYKIALVAGALGFFVRSASLIAALANVFAWSVAFAFEHTAHFHAVPLILLSIALCPVKSPTIIDYGRAVLAGRSPATIGAYPAWVRFAVIFAISAAYFQAGIEKLIRSGPLWLNGRTLAGHLLRVGTEVGLRAAEAPLAILIAASIAALIWELAFGLVLFFPRLRPAGAISALIFHATLYVTMGLGFPHLVIALLFLAPPARALAAEAPPMPAARGRLVLIAALMFVQWVPTFVRGGVYPFLAYDMFNGYYRGDEAMVREARASVLEGDRWRPIDPSRAFSFSAMHFTEQIFYRYVSEHPRHAKYKAERVSYCESLLGHARSAIAPDAIALRLDADVVRARAPGQVEPLELVTCRKQE